MRNKVLIMSDREQPVLSLLPPLACALPLPCIPYGVLTSHPFLHKMDPHRVSAEESFIELIIKIKHVTRAQFSL